jgi:hypothetical protein
MGDIVSRQRQVLASIDGRATHAAVRRAVQVVGCGVDWNGNGTPFLFCLCPFCEFSRQILFVFPPVFLIRLPGKRRLKFCPKNSKIHFVAGLYPLSLRDEHKIKKYMFLLTFMRQRHKNHHSEC